MRVIRQVREDLRLYLTCPATPMLEERGDEQPCALCICVDALRTLSTRHRAHLSCEPWLWLAGGAVLFF